MKLVKLSLAAVVAAGSFSFANAVALDEAIQNVDLSGYLRYRYETITHKSDGDVYYKDKQNHQLRGHLKLTADIADNFKATAVFRYDTKEYSYGDEARADVDSTFKVREGYLTYNNYDTSVNLGRMEVGSIWTDDLVGNGVKVVNNSIEGLTFAAYMFDNFDTSSSDLIGEHLLDGSVTFDDKGNLIYNSFGLMNKQIIKDIEVSVYNTALSTTNKLIKDGLPIKPGMEDAFAKTIVLPSILNNAATMNKINNLVVYGNLTSLNSMLYSNNLYGIAVMGSFAPVDAQLWLSYLNNVGTLYALDLAANFGDKDSVAYNIHAQYAGNSLKNDVKEYIGFANGNFYGIEAGVNAYGFDGSLGYVGFGKKDKWTINTLHNKGRLINSGELIMDKLMTASIGKSDFVFAELGYTYADVRFGVDVIYGKNKISVSSFDMKRKLFEVTPRLSYKYSDKLEFSSFYAMSKTKVQFDKRPSDNYSTRTDKIRLEAKYTF
ncbi:major outer membrane protein [Campylobacter sp. MG1]|uniref:major outer membrane protein n=1 Tax=Campylobacter sp. MG1 TaxID=2976332 RepID=UPI00226CCBB5|nr:major outer membrane protein [Campylobacter sp. MG1]